MIVVDLWCGRGGGSWNTDDKEVETEIRGQALCKDHIAMG